MLIIENLVCFRNDTALFSPVTMCAKDSNLWVVNAANGVGKTTLLKTIAGLHVYYEGSLEVKPKAIIRYVGHENALVPDLTVVEYLRLMADVQNGSYELIMAAMHFFKLTDYKDHLLRNLSRGWKRKAALARLMVAPGDIWLLDEPFANLDEEGREAIGNLLAVHCDKGGVAVITSPMGKNPMGIGKTTTLEQCHAS